MKEVEFGSLFEFIRNGMNIQQDKSGDGLPITRIETIWNGVVDPDRVGFADLREEDCKQWLLKPGDILLSHINSVEHIGKCALYEGEPNKLIHGMNLLCLRSDTSKLIPAYARWLIRDVSFKFKLANFVNKAVNQASLSIGNLKTIPVRVPSLEEQRRIAAILDKADALRQKRRAALQKLDSLTQSLFLDMFGDGGGQRVKLGALAEIRTGGTPSREKDTNFGGNIPWVKTTEVAGGEIIRTEEQLTEQGLANSNCRLFPRGSIVVAMYGQGKTRGQCAILGIEAATNQACAVIIPNERFRPRFLLSLLKDKYNELRSLARGGNQANLNLEIIRDIEIPLPELDLQRIFERRLAVVSCIEDRFYASTKTLESSFASLQHRAFRGEL